VSNVLYGVGYLLTVAGLSISGWLAYRRPDQPGKRPFLLILGVLVLFFARNATYAFDIYSSITIVDAINNALFQMSLVLFGAFAFLYTGRGITVTRNVRLLFGTLMALCLTIPINFLTTGPVHRLAELTFICVFVLTIPIFMYGVYIFVWSGFVDETLPGGASALLASIGVLCIPINPLTPPIPRWFMVVLGLLFTACFLTVLVRYRLFEGPPAMGYLARDPVFNAMDEAIVAVDREGQFTDANATAREIFGIQPVEDVGRSLDAVLGTAIDPKTGGSVDLDTVDGTRSFVHSPSPIVGEDDEEIGRTFVFRDVTEEQTREQQLEVFNRVLRHNLRNDLDAIRGFAETLDETDGERPVDTATIAERIHSLSSDLSKTGATAKRAEQIRTKEQLRCREQSTETFVRSLTAEVGDRLPACDLTTVTRSGPVHLHTDWNVLETVLLEVIENAVEHTDSATPTVELRVQAERGGVEFAVRDEGDGIPERERRVLREGEVNQLQHGTGIGLWLVSWGVRRLGGELSFDDSGAGGTTVRLFIPDQGSTATASTDGNEHRVGVEQ
jgi:signal transduction histidine kinase